MGRGPARPTNFRDDEPRPYPANPFSRRRAAVRPRAYHFQMSTARLGRSFFQTSPLGVARPSNFERSRPVTIFRSAQMAQTAHDKPCYFEPYTDFDDRLHDPHRPPYPVIYILQSKQYCIPTSSGTIIQHDIDGFTRTIKTSLMKSILKSSQIA